MDRACCWWAGVLYLLCYSKPISPYRCTRCTARAAARRHTRRHAATHTRSQPTLGTENLNFRAPRGCLKGTRRSKHDSAPITRTGGPLPPPPRGAEVIMAQTQPEREHTLQSFLCSPLQLFLWKWLINTCISTQTACLFTAPMRI
jgi:hypothetical protein